MARDLRTWTGSSEAALIRHSYWIGEHAHHRQGIWFGVGRGFQLPSQNKQVNASRVAVSGEMDPLTIPYWTPLALHLAHSGPPQAAGAAAAAGWGSNPAGAGPGWAGDVLPRRPQLRPAEPLLGRSRFCAHLGAGIRVGATTESSLVSEAAGCWLQFCHGRTAVSPTTVPRTRQPPTLFPAPVLLLLATRGGRSGEGGRWFPANRSAESKLALCWLGPSESAPPAAGLCAPRLQLPRCLALEGGAGEDTKNHADWKAWFLCIACWPNFVFNVKVQEAPTTHCCSLVGN